LLLVDFINPLDFPEASQLTGPALEAATAASELARAARTHGIPVIFANDNFGRWRSDFSSIIRALSRGGGPSARLTRLMRPQRGDLIVLKPMHSAFYGTPLDILLGKIGARSLIVAGLATDICIQLTAADAFLRGLKVHAPADCTAAETLEKKASGLAYMADILKCDIRPWQTARWTRAQAS
jgi:nicotinamidase-related amidase